MDTRSGRPLDLTNLPVTCACNEAVGNFNTGIEAYVSLKENPTPWFEAALEIQKDLVIAHCLLGYFQLFGLKPPTDPDVVKHLDAVNKVDDSLLHERELFYKESFNSYASNNLLEAASVLQAMLIKYPSDAVGAHLLVRSCIVLGEFERVRDTMAWILSFWKEDQQLYPYLLAFYSYALEECNQREKAEVLAKKALDINRATPFAYHAMAHVMEETKEAGRSVEFFSQSKENWITSVYGVHLTWHLCLYYLDLGDTTAVLREFDSVISEKISPDVLYGMLDGASLLWRLNLAGEDPGEERWCKVTDAVTKHLHNHQSPWFSSHIMMCLARGGRESAARLELARTMMQSLQAHVEEEGGVITRKRVYEKLGIPVCNALLAFGHGRYDEVLQIMLPIKNDLFQVGGSWAQRQVFNVTMIEAAVKSNDIPTALGLVAELQARKPNNRTLQVLFKKLKESYISENQLKSQEKLSV